MKNTRPQDRKERGKSGPGFPVFSYSISISEKPRIPTCFLFFYSYFGPFAI